MTDKPTPTPSDAELKTMWQLHAADIGGIFDFARAVLAKWGTLRADKIVIPTDTMEQEFQQHYRRGYEAGKKASTPQPTQPVEREPLTPEQIERDRPMMVEPAAYAAGVRYAEKHHGIKGGRHGTE